MNLEEIKKKFEELVDVGGRMVRLPIPNSNIAWLIAEVERLREAIKDLNALRRNDQKLTEKAEAELVQLREELKLRINQRDAHKQQTGDFIEQNKKLEARVKAQDIVIAEYKADDYDRIKELEEELKEERMLSEEERNIDPGSGVEKK